MTAAPSRPSPAPSRTSSARRITWREAFTDTLDRLGDRTEARWLVEEVSGLSWPELSAAPAVEMSDRCGARLQEMVRRRTAGEPIQYVIGHWPFRTLDLMVDPRVLIPRPETEYVVEMALSELDALAHDPAAPSGAAGGQTVVDLGTGSGAIALSVVSERPGVRVLATDASREAIRVATANLAGLGGHAATRVRLFEGDWWSALPDQFRGEVDLVVSNPPYISTDEMDSLDRTVRDWEPPGALESGPSGLEAVRAVLSGAAGGWLRPGGSAVVEIAPHQAGEASRIASDAGFASVVVRRDLAGRERVLVARVAP